MLKKAYIIGVFLGCAAILSSNLFTNAHAAVQVEGNFGGTAGIAGCKDTGTEKFDTSAWENNIFHRIGEAPVDGKRENYSPVFCNHGWARRISKWYQVMEYGNPFK